MPAGPQRRTPHRNATRLGSRFWPPAIPRSGAYSTTPVRPALHGHKVWPTSFVLLDYLHQRGVAPQARVLELGCGWGLVGIACAKTFQAR